MPKRVKKSVARAKSKYFPAKNLSLPHKIWLSAGIGAVILILAVMFLFPYLEEGVVGKAFEPDDAPFFSIIDTYKDTKTDNLLSGGGCILNYCYAQSKSECYAPGTIFSKNLLCGAPNDGKDWIGCDSNGKLYNSIKSKNEEDSSAKTLSGEMYYSVTTGSVNINNLYYCGGDQNWYPCYDGTKKMIVPTASKKYLCNGKNWVGCGANNIGISSNFPQFYCETDKYWNTCENKDEKLSNDKAAYCKNENWVVICNSDMVTKKVLLDNKIYCENNNQPILYCSIKLKDTDNLIKNNNYICSWDKSKGPDNKWHLCDKDTTEKRVNENKYYCDKDGNNYLWSKCDSSGKASKDGQYLCSGEEWVKVSGKNYCVDEKCETCDSSKTGSFSSDQKAYCLTNQWEICVTGEKGISSDKKAFCGSNGEWMFCPNKNFPAPVNSDYFCDGTNWFSCSQSNYGEWKQSFVCDGSQWSYCLSEKLDLANTFFCPKKGNFWLACNKAPGVDETNCPADAQGVRCDDIGVTSMINTPKYYCDKDQSWKECTSANQFSLVQESASLFWQCTKLNDVPSWTKKECTLTQKNIQILNNTIPIYRCDGSLWKPMEYVDKSLSIKSDSLFEVSFSKNKQIKQLNALSKLTLCDIGTESLPDRASYCHAGNLNGEVITSLLYLSGAGGKIYTKMSDGENLAFFYEKQDSSENKVISTVLIKDITTNPASFGLGNFHQNLLSKQRLVLLQSGEYYLLSYPNTDSFELKNLKLAHLPDLKSYTLKEIFPGSVAEFPVEAGKVITIEITGNTLKVSSQKSTLAGAGVVYPVDLLADFEWVITVDNPVNLITPKLAKIGGKDVTKIYICDKESLIEKLDMCYNDETTKKTTLFSLSYLQALPKEHVYKETVALNTKVTFIYGKEVWEPEEKKIKMILAKDISSANAVFDSNVFSKNLREKRRLVITVNGEDYLLSHPEGDYFSYAYLKLNHLPTWNDYVLYLKGPVYLPSQKVTGVQFKVFDQLITIYEKGVETIISSKLPPGEATFFAPPVNIESNYEANFSPGNPVELVDYGKSIISVCDTDNAGDPIILTICVNDDPWTTLVQKNSTRAELNSKELTLLYHLEDLFQDQAITSTDEFGNIITNTSSVKTGTKKQGYIFFRQILSAVSLDLDYNNFIDNLLAGRRISLDFQNKQYLLQHPVTNLLDLPSLSLHLLVKNAAESTDITIPAVGSEKKVTFTLPDGGRVTLERDYGQPPPPFKVWAQTKQEIADIPVDLAQELYTTFSSENPINIVNPNFGIITVDSSDIKGLINSFKLSSTTKGEFILNKDQPLVKDKVLFYYDSAYILNNQYIKSAKAYLFYDLAQLGQSHIFNDEFIEIFTGGNELALKYADSYYILGYQGASSEGIQFFDLKNLYLKTMIGSVLYSPVVDGLSATFSTAAGNIIVTIDDINNKILFSTAGKEILITEEFAVTEYSMILSPENKIKIGSVTYSQCDTTDTEVKENIVLLCSINPAKPTSLVKDMPIKLGNYLFWYKGKVGGKKQIKIMSLSTIYQSNLVDLFGWGNLQKNVSAGKSPAFSWKDQYFEFTGTGDLNTFALKTIPKGELYPINNVKTSTQDLQNGTFVYNHYLLNAIQSWTGQYQTKLTLKPLDYLLVTEEAFNVTGETSFTPSFDTPVYNAKVFTYNPKLVSVTFAENDQIFAYYLLPKEATKTVLLPNGEVIEIEVIDQTTITLKK